MFCGRCGNQMPDGSAFCPACGQVVEVQPPPAPPAQVEPLPTVPPAPATFPPPQPSASVAPVGERYPRAPIGARLGAWIADGIIASPLISVGALLFAAGIVRDELSVLGVILMVAGGLWSAAYTLGRDALSGAGFGKQLAGLVVVSYETGAPVKGGPTAIRHLVFWATNLLPGIGSLVEPVLTLVDSEGRRLGDKLAKTQVVRIEDAARRGHSVARNKTVAIVLLVATLILSIAGSTIGSIVFARSLYGAVNEYDYSVPDASTDPEWGGEAAPSEGAPATKDPAPGGETAPAPGLTADIARDTVGQFLYARQNGDAAAAAQYATQQFQSQYDWFFDGTGPIQFEVLEVAQDAAVYVVIVREEWQSGPENLYYWVTFEDGRALVSDVAWEDQL